MTCLGNRARGLGLLVVASAFVGCGNDRVAGGSSTETSNRLAARFVGEDGQTASGAEVRIRPSAWQGGSDAPSIDGLRTYLDTLLDADGRLFARDFAPGSYTVEVVTRGLALRVALATGEASTVDTLRVPGGVAGEFQPGWAGTVQVLGTDLRIQTDAKGSFLRDGIPSGPIVLELRADSAGVVRRLQVRTVVPPRAVADLGSLRLLTMEESELSLWLHRQRLILDNTKTGLTRDVPDFPLWIPLADSQRAGLQPDGSDLRVQDEDGRLRPLEASTAGLEGLWARMPRIDGSSKEHHLDVYWGRPGAPTKSDAQAVFDSSAGWRGVWHFDGSPGCATRGCGTLSGTTVFDLGLAGSAVRFDGSSTLRVVDSGTLEPADLTVSLWVHLQSIAGSEARLVWKDSDGQSSLPSWGFLVRKSGPNLSVGFRTRNGPSDSGLFTTLPTGRWVHLAATVARVRKKAELFVDGVSQGTFPVDSIPPAPRTGDLVLGQGIVGRIDELRVSRSVRSDAWIELEHINLTMPGTLLHP